jgi:hypothetical protein
MTSGGSGIRIFSFLLKFILITSSRDYVILMEKGERYNLDRSQLNPPFFAGKSNPGRFSFFSLP